MSIQHAAVAGFPAGVVEHASAAVLDDALERLRLDGAIFFRAEFTEPWAYQSPPPQVIGPMLHPGAERLIMFHIVARGRCWVTVADGERHWAEAGDVIVLPYGDQHCVGGNDDVEVVPIDTLFAPPPWQTLPVLRYGSGGEATDIVCGYLHSTDPLFDPDLAALPPAFVVKLAEEPAARWVQSSIDYALAMSEASLPAEPLSTRLPELVVTEVLRSHLSSAPAIDGGWIAALRDPVLMPALALLHRDTGRKWTLSELAAEVAVSRSVLDERFRNVLGRSPMRYLAEWRMHVARGLLRGTDFTVARISRQVGYDSEEAFSRAFRRHHDETPSRWRAAAIPS